ncbi:MAG TPA: biopolymer transporter ExbD [Kofleriaceae bacterium]|jgi:biopolymer transport protein ExbD
MRILPAVLAAFVAFACSNKEERSEPAAPPTSAAPEKVDPPAAALAPADAGAALAPELALTLTPDGKTLLAGTPVEAANLAAELQKAAAHATPLVIVADPKVPHGRVVEVMELAKKAGVEKMSIRTEAPP